ncbi:hypothetical protein N5J48_05535 [Acinetobacter ursingii]|mgnify:FL=1|uniref:Uncharacterized protein n=1 Tax=Acinetobacter ursingii TaxID=108980 RepID=A0AA46NP65_9GAMM|nr:hypothetical protein [Acinetobacter ursingii]MDA3578047.1 hypothetical protein [Acinetobacter ursingii]MDG9860374.1 hypothetical protein [Acinetobacter ursingii]MDG9893513.1 hypothetical protein [Acinetobacter ursingii]MDH0007181.1 hypothetical protein [Acinetobacter ursingii]MDH0191710.1 hypothetical protein [Acinetobacter ursingii]
MVNHQFQLKRSLLALLFQLGMLLLIGIIWFQLFPFYIFLIAIFLAIIAYLAFLRRSKMRSLAYLDQDLWSIQWRNHSKIEHVQLYRVIDHHIYIVLYFKQNRNSQIIWRDQVSLNQWKQLKVMAKLV